VWFADLSPIIYFGHEHATYLRAIGWLEHGQAFAKGVVDAQVYRRLVALLKEPWEPFVFMGVHGCGLCHYEPACYGAKNVYVPGDGVVYVCPELVTHYMNAHQYAPPHDFCDAVLKCPEMSSSQYFRALLAGGAKSLVFAARGDGLEDRG
jgi:hypothetical protein